MTRARMLFPSGGKNRAKLDATMNQIKRDAVKQQTLKSQEPVKISKGRVNEPHLKVDRGI